MAYDSSIANALEFTAVLISIYICISEIVLHHVKPCMLRPPVFPTCEVEASNLWD